MKGDDDVGRAWSSSAEQSRAPALQSTTPYDKLLLRALEDWSQQAICDKQLAHALCNAYDSIRRKRSRQRKRREPTPRDLPPSIRDSAGRHWTQIRDVEEAYPDVAKKFGRYDPTSETKNDWIERWHNWHRRLRTRR